MRDMTHLLVQSYTTLINGDRAIDPEKLIKLVAEECAQICEDYSQQILKFSQFGSNAAKDCSELIREKYDLNEK